MEQDSQIHIMLDLETLGTKPDAAIISVGMVASKRGLGKEPEILESLDIAIDLDSALASGGIIDAATLMWWMQHEQETARAAYLGYQESHSMAAALVMITKFIHNYATGTRAPLIWGNGSDFDNVVLRNAFDRSGLIVPWNFRQNRCFRTLKNMRPEFMELEPEFLGVRHNALDDAMHQTKWLHSILNLLEGYYTPWPI